MRADQRARVFFRYPAWDTIVTPAPTCVARTSEVKVYSAGDERALLEDTKD